MGTSLEELIALARQRHDEWEGDEPGSRLIGMAQLPTRFGHFRAVAFRDPVEGKEHLAVIRGEVVGAERVLVRLQSECLTGDALGSLRCDCRDQLEGALRLLGQAEAGVLLYLRQEGRGIGLANKIRAYALQDEGLDTFAANRALGFRDDERDYAIAAHMLTILRIRSVRLMTNNPDKLAQLTARGITVVERVPHAFPPNPHNERYLRAKATHSGHMIPDSPCG